MYGLDPSCRAVLFNQQAICLGLLRGQVSESASFFFLVETKGWFFTSTSSLSKIKVVADEMHANQRAKSKFASALIAHRSGR